MARRKPPSGVAWVLGVIAIVMGTLVVIQMLETAYPWLR